MNIFFFICIACAACILFASKKANSVRELFSSSDTISEWEAFSPQSFQMFRIIHVDDQQYPISFKSIMFPTKVVKAQKFS